MGNDYKTPDWLREGMKDPVWRQKNPEVAALTDAATGEFNATPSQVADLGKRAMRRSQNDDRRNRPDRPAVPPSPAASVWARLFGRGKK